MLKIKAMGKFSVKLDFLVMALELPFLEENSEL